MCDGRRPGESLRKKVAYTAFRSPWIVILTLDVDHMAGVQLVLEIGLTTYDVSYLWLARDLAIKLACSIVGSPP